MIKNMYYVVNFHHIDEDRCFHPLEDDVIGSNPHEELDPTTKSFRLKLLRAELESLFRQAGWEGDGTIECLFMPPCFIQRGGLGGPTYCTTIYHVKQSNNGTSWLAIPKGFEFGLPDGFLAKRK